MPVPPPARASASNTKRLSEPAQLDHGNPSARAAWNASSAVWTSQPIRTPQIPSRPPLPGRRASPKYATAASPYASSAGQNSSSANRGRLPLLHAVAPPPRQLRQLRQLALEPADL